ncbi:MAG: SDR family oxidoreductase [Deltaproteobacteria bacterium]|nr:SDR family oxidoreductase [Deltaproteobacteria bacterium]
MKNVVVTGANRGIGLEFVRQWLAGGHRVIGTARRPPEAAELAALKKATGDRLEVLELDAADDRSVAKFARALHFEAIDVLVNNAGVLLDEGRSWTRLDTGRMLETFNVNSIGPLRVTSAVRPMLTASGRALVVNISSGAGSIAGAEPSDTMVAYRMSKAALNMANRSVAEGLVRDHIVSVAMCPGWVRTDMGGPNASLAVEESVAAMMATIARLTLRDAGRFIDRNGTDIAW